MVRQLGEKNRKRNKRPEENQRFKSYDSQKSFHLSTALRQTLCYPCPGRVWGDDLRDDPEDIPRGVCFEGPGQVPLSLSGRRGDLTRRTEFILIGLFHGRYVDYRKSKQTVNNPAGLRVLILCWYWAIDDVITNICNFLLWRSKSLWKPVV